MEKEERKLFVVNPEKPMKFCIYKGQMLNIKCKQISAKIQKHGGIVVDYEDKDSECIILAHKSCIPNDKDVFNIKYIRKCISENETLNLLDYKIGESQEQQDTSNCISLTRILNDEKCVHRTVMTAEEILKRIKDIVDS